VYEDQAVSEYALLVPEEGPLHAGGKVVADTIDVERDKKEQALTDERQPETGHKREKRF
jgi:hypothetical protein